MSSPEDRSRFLTQKLADYFLLYQDCSDRVKQYRLPDTQIIYDEAYKDWLSDSSNPLVEPPVGDQAKIDAHFANCDSICALEPRNPHDLYRISFACWAGIQVIKSKQLADMPNKEEIIVTASNVAVKKFKDRNPSRQLPSHVRAGFVPSTFKEREVNPLVGTTFRFFDGKSGEVRECTVNDCGTSFLRGDWVEILYDMNDDMNDDMKETQISLEDFEVILANRVA